MSQPPPILDSVALPSRIESVTVYRSGAVVRRIARLEPKDGRLPDAVRLDDLPLCLDDAGLRIRIESDEPDAPPVTATAWRVVLSVPNLEEAEKGGADLDKALRDARLHVRNCEDELQSIERQTQRMESLKPPSRPRGAYGEPPPASPAGARLALVEFQRTELNRLSEKAGAARKELQKAREQLRMAADRHRRASNVRVARVHEVRKAVVVPLQAEEPTAAAVSAPCRLVLEYPVPGARWSPGYVARFTPQLNQAELTLRALVSQATGEDWTGVHLTLSTAEPQTWCELPELRSLRIGRRQAPPSSRGWRPAPADTDSLFEDYRQARARIEEPINFQSTMAGGGGGGEAEEAAEGGDQASFFEALPEAAAPQPPDAALAGAVALGPPPTAKKRRAPTLRGAAMVRAAPAMLSAPESGAPAKQEAPSASQETPRQLLDYGRLRLAGPNEPQAGTLSPAQEFEGYCELLIAMRVELRWSLRTTLRQVTQRAHDLADLPAGFAPVESWKGFDHAYRSDQSVDVPSDGACHHVTLLRRSARADLRYVVVPRETPQAFRVVTLDNPLSAPLPAGPVDVYAGDDFLVTSRLDPVPAEGRAELGLGVDEGVRVARNAHFQEQSTGLIRGRLGLEHRVELELRHSQPRALPFEIRERLPVRRQDDDGLDIEVLDVKPPWEAFKQDGKPVDGTFRWNVLVEPDTTRRLSFRYIVRIAPRHELVGGNRREP